MNRRKFIVNILKAGSIYFLIPELSLANKLFSAPGGEIFIPGKGFQKLSLLWLKNRPYASVEELASLLQTNTYFNNARRKIVLYYEGHRFIITGENSFVVIDGKTYQMPYQAKWINDQIYVPIKEFVHLFNRITRAQLSVSGQKEKMTEKSAPEKYTIEEFSIDYKKDGLLIHLKVDHSFSPEDLAIEFRNDWLFIDFYKARMDSALIRRNKVRSPIKEIKLFPQKEMASVGLKLERKAWEKEEWLSPSDGIVKLLVKNSTFDYNKEEKEYEERKSGNDKSAWIIDTIVIDPGHGGKDPGAIGYKKLKEKDVVLKIALKLRDLIKKHLPDTKVILTRDRDVFVSLKERTQMANRKQGKLFVSIHANSIRNKRVSGFETYILGEGKESLAREIVMKENSVIQYETEDVRKEYEGLKMIIASLAQSAFMKQSSYLAELVQQELAKEMRSAGLKDRGVKQGPFWVMVGATMPNILVETGFISNKHDAKILRTEKYQLRIAKGIFNGIQRYKKDIESVL